MDTSIPGTMPIWAIRFIHKALRRHAEIVEVMCAEEPGFEETREIADRVAVLAKRMLAHTRGEEDVLFPAVDRHVPGASEPYRDDHREEMAILASLEAARSLLASAKSADRDEYVVALQREAGRLSEHLHDHVRREHRKLLPVVEQHLDASEQIRIMKEMNRILADGDSDAAGRWIAETLDEHEKIEFETSGLRP
jgi:iron-sulfur cluster repair protein YtfE (RIC family)